VRSLEGIAELTMEHSERVGTMHHIYALGFATETSDGGLTRLAWLSMLADAGLIR